MNIFETYDTQTIVTELAAMTLAEALAMAQEFEATAASFYRDLARRVPVEVSSLADELADEEVLHGSMIRELAADPELAEHLHQQILAPVSTPTFETFITPLVLPDEPIEEDLLDYAESREEIAREHYGYLAELAPPGPLRDLFQYLQQEEQKHADHLKHRWSDLFSVF